MAILSIGVEIVYVTPEDRDNRLAERYRARDNSLSNVKDLLKKEIDNIDKKYHFYNVITVKFTG